jgi:peptide/nickel transport system ATP-binding protein
VSETATLKGVFREPSRPCTQGLLRSAPKVEQAGELATIPGAVPNPVNPTKGCRFTPRCAHAKDIRRSAEPELEEAVAGVRTVACHRWREL